MLDKISKLSSITNLEYDEYLYECINEYNEIKYLLNERTKHKYKNLKIIYIFIL